MLSERMSVEFALSLLFNIILIINVSAVIINITAVIIIMIATIVSVSMIIIVILLSCIVHWIFAHVTNIKQTATSCMETLVICT